MRFIKLLIIIFPIILLSGCYNKVPIERTSVLSGVGADVVDNQTLSSSYEFLIFSGENKITKNVLTNKGSSIFEIYNKRLLEAKKTLLPGTIRLLLISEDRAKLGIHDIIDAYLRDQDRNLNTTIAICKERAEEILNMMPKEATSMSEEIEDLVKSSYQTNFTQRDTNIKDLFNMQFQNGRVITLPYLEKSGETVKITSIAVFQNDKMAFTVPTEDLKYINILRNNSSTGYLAFKSEDLLNSTDLLCKSKRKVKVESNDDQINYIIKIKMSALLKEVDEEKFKELDKKTLDNLEKLFSQELESKLNDIAKKYRDNYGIDVFDVQKYALAQFGKDKEDFVREKFKSSNIKVELKISVNSVGRLIR